MSVNGNYSGGLEPPRPVQLSNITKTDILNADDNSIFVGAVGCANESGSAVIIKLFYFDGGTDHVIFRRQIPANDTIIMSDLPLRLTQGDKLKAQLETGSIDVTVTPIVQRSFPNESFTIGA